MGVRAAGRVLALVHEHRRSGLSAAEAATLLGQKVATVASHMRELERLGSVRRVRVRINGALQSLFLPAG